MFDLQESVLFGTGVALSVFVSGPIHQMFAPMGALFFIAICLFLIIHAIEAF